MRYIELAATRGTCNKAPKETKEIQRVNKFVLGDVGISGTSDNAGGGGAGLIPGRRVAAVIIYITYIYREPLCTCIIMYL